VIRRLAILALAFACLAPALRGDAAPPILVAQGVTLAGIPVGGMSYEQAQAAVRPAFARPLRLVFKHRRWRVRSARFGVSVAVAEGVTRALDADPGAAVPLVPRIAAKAVKAYVRRLDRRFSYPAKNAELLGLEGIVPQFSDATPGRKVVTGVTTKRIVRALQSSRRPRIRVSVKAVAPKITPANFGPVVVIRRSSNALLYYEGRRLLQTFGVATGQAVYPTPLGTWSVVDMQRNPWWRPPDSPWAKGLQPIPPGPGNPLGTRWMGLSAPGVGMHGTPDDASIGYSASHGCIRMHIPDAEWLFVHVHIGTPVIITDS
jgi:lipoprotein-anchoring transpeptidase ErfK/SrfK